MNNDGLPDIIQDTSQTTSSDPYGIRVRLANGDGTFRDGYSYNFPSGSQGPYSMATGDLNNDGKVDLVFTDDTTQLIVFLGNGDGTFQAPRYEKVTLPPQLSSAAKTSASTRSHSPTSIMMAGST